MYLVERVKEQLSIPNGAFYRIPNGFLVENGGSYLLYAFMMWGDLYIKAGSVRVQFSLNGEARYIGRCEPVKTFSPVYFDAGDRISIEVYQNTGQTMSLMPGSKFIAAEMHTKNK